MTYQEKSAWIVGLLTLVIFGLYANELINLREAGLLAEAGYQGIMLKAVGAYIVLSIIFHVIIGILSHKDAEAKDQRDKEIDRYGEYMGQYIPMMGAVSALFMALAEWNYFWIANTIFFSMGAGTVLASIAKVLAYRSGAHQW